VSAPLTWDEVGICAPGDFTLATMPSRFAKLGDLHAGIDDHPGSLASLLQLVERHERDGLGDAPWPPQYKKQAGEPPRVQPSRRSASKQPSNTPDPDDPSDTSTRVSAGDAPPRKPSRARKRP
jgi:hypothetical protein